MLHDRKWGVPREMEQVAGGAGDQVVDRQNFPAAIDEAIAKVRSEKSRASRDYRAQWDGLFMPLLSGRLRFFMTSFSLKRSKLVGTLNFIVAPAVFGAKSDPADQARYRNCLTRPQGRRLESAVLD
jgi:hypothetical protein